MKRKFGCETMSILLLSSILLLVSACHPLSPFGPSNVKSSKLSDESPQLVQVAYDDMGVPFIKAKSMHQTMYGLGFVHARDRLFQLDLMRHAATGRTGELFGERGLSVDRKMRILTYRLEEQIENLSEEEHALLNAYVQGVNAGAKQRGRSAEHFLLGLQFEEFTKKDVVAIARFESWLLASDLFAEIAHLAIAQADLPHETKSELLSAMDDRGSAIINISERYAQRNYDLPKYLGVLVPTLKKTPGHDLVQTEGGASNAWVVDKQHTKDGSAVLMNDPHLQHNWPSNFYLATLSADDYFVTGATFVGLPGILIGATKNLAWGVTASCLNTQDLVVLEIAKDDQDSYVVDGKPMRFEQWPQRFCTNKKGTCTEEVYQLSMFGPVIDNRFASYLSPTDRFAVQWTGFNIEQHKNPSGGFAKLAQMRNVSDGIKIVQSMTLPGVNLVLADTNGNIGYAYAGIVPQRDRLQHPFLPLDGRLSRSKWSEFLPMGEEPAVMNPSSGFIVTANQNIFSSNAHPDLGFGKQGMSPYRALRIKDRIETMLKEGPSIDFDQLSTLQLDETSAEARELAHLIGPICVQEFADKDKDRQKFAQAVSDFDGKFTVESENALPYEMLMAEIVSQKQKAVFGELASPLAYVNQVNYAIKNALLKGLQGIKTAVFISDGGATDAKTQVMAACEPAFQTLVKKAGTRSKNWRWGNHHFLERQSPLAKAPFFGRFFRDKKREVAGTLNAPMAEAGLPVMYGANLRFRVKMTNTPEIYAVLDSGNSGTVGHKNALDQADLWHEGKSMRINTDWEQARQNAKTFFAIESPQ